MATATVPVRVLVTVSLIVMLVLGLAIGYFISDATRDDMPMRTTFGMDAGDMPMSMMSGMDAGDMEEHMDDMSAHMEEMGMDMGSMMGWGSKDRPARDMPAMHGHD